MDFVWVLLLCVPGAMICMLVLISVNEYRIRVEKEEKQKRLLVGLSRTCEDCKFNDFLQCLHPDVKELTGRMQKVAARFESGPCGIEGKFWEEKA